VAACAAAAAAAAGARLAAAVAAGAAAAGTAAAGTAAAGAAAVGAVTGAAGAMEEAARSARVLVGGGGGRRGSRGTWSITWESVPPAEAPALVAAGDVMLQWKTGTVSAQSRGRPPCGGGGRASGVSEQVNRESVVKRTKYTPPS